MSALRTIVDDNGRECYRVRVTYLDQSVVSAGWYRVHIRDVVSGEWEILIVRGPACRSHYIADRPDGHVYAVDAPESFDAAALAALGMVEKLDPIIDGNGLPEGLRTVRGRSKGAAR